ncbi:MAG: PEP/pyruvate-binding domain-containing protein, partial [Acetanaerobacterium sp.]
MAAINNRVSTGNPGMDDAIGFLRLGDNVVWQTDSVDDYRTLARAFACRAEADGRRLVYIRFGTHEPVLDGQSTAKVYKVAADDGFEAFATRIHEIITAEGRCAFYVFDCLSELLTSWHSDLMTGNFFKITCPYLYELDTVAYFAILRSLHTYDTIARIRETTQVLIDLYHVKGSYYIHPLKVWERYSPTMFLPHRLGEDGVVSITSSAESAELFSSLTPAAERLDYWEITFREAHAALSLPEWEQEETKELILGLLIGRQPRVRALCREYFTLSDLLRIKRRQIGTGFIGGKTVGMLLARRILKAENGALFDDLLEQHDSFYLGSDVFYTYIVQNGWWRLRVKQKTPEGYYKYAPKLREKLLGGQFSASMREQFQQMLEYFGQSPIIVRSSSLLEDDFGNAFAGKYESVFCANQGTPEERYQAFEQAVRRVYASMMNEDALAYRLSRRLIDRDEQMALLIQRVSGDYHGEAFFPHVAGVGNSSNLYVWDKCIDMSAGMLRLVFGLGTRAVDRVTGDYARIVSLDLPARPPLIAHGDERRFSQHSVDVISLTENALVSRPLDEVMGYDIRTDRETFAEPDYDALRDMRERGMRPKAVPHILTFKRLLAETRFPAVMREMLSLLSRVYDYPVDIEFTANFDVQGGFQINLVQCRPLQTRGLGRAVEMPEITDTADCILWSSGSFMGGNVRLALDYAVYIDAPAYLALSERDKYAVARLTGALSTALRDESFILIGPGRWGTTTPSLGVPVRFSEISACAVLCEVATPTGGMMPELSYGSHFFQDLVETGIFYAAVFGGGSDAGLNAGKITARENLLAALVPDAQGYEEVIRVADT